MFKILAVILAYLLVLLGPVEETKPLPSWYCIWFLYWTFMFCYFVVGIFLYPRPN